MLKKLLLILSMTISIISCSPALVNLPDCPKQEIPQCPEVVSYPALDMPPIPRVIHCTIEPNLVKADKGCEELIRNYAAARKVIKKWQGLH